MQPGQKVKILLVDDQPNNLLALEAVLTDPKYSLVKAHSGQEALRHLLREDFALILLDVMMPGMDGFETAELIRRRERTRYTPIIFVTAIGRSDAHVARGYSAGAVDYLFKPLVPEILKSKVAAFVELFEKNEEVKRQGELLRELERREHETKLAAAHRQLDEERMRQEIRMAQVIQQRLFPTEQPTCPGLEIWGASYPAEETGGDYFDYMNVTDGNIDVVIADVSGHGYGPALVMASTRAYLRALAIAHTQLATFSPSSTESWPPMSAVIISSRFCSPDSDPHPARLPTPAPAICQAISSTARARSGRRSESTSIPLGILHEGEFSSAPPVTFERGDLIFLYTDGVVEATSPDGQMFGIERTLDVIRSTRSQPACDDREIARGSQPSVRRTRKTRRRLHGHRHQSPLAPWPFVCR